MSSPCFSGSTAWARILVALSALFACVFTAHGQEATVVHSAIVAGENTLSDGALAALALEHGAIEIWTRKEDGAARRQMAHLGTPGYANPGFTSYHREEYSDYLAKGFVPELLKDGSEELRIPLSGEAFLIYRENPEKGTGAPSFTMQLVVDGKTVVTETRYEEQVGGIVRPTLLRVDYPGGAMIQVFEVTAQPPAPLPPVLLRKVGSDTPGSVDAAPKLADDKEDGTQVQEVQFIVPPQGLGDLGFDSGWVPGGYGPDPGGFIIQVRLNATAGYVYDASVNGTFNLNMDSMLGLGPAAGSWGFNFGANFTMKAAFSLPPILGYTIDPFVVDIPYVPDFTLVTSDRDHFNSWLLEEESTVRDESGRTQVAKVDLLALILSSGILPELPSWVPLPKIGAALDVSAIANGRLSCESISVSDGTVFTLEGQEVQVDVPEEGYQETATYNEDAELNLGVKFYPNVFFTWLGFSSASSL